MALVYPAGYFDRTDETKYYDKHLFRSNYVLQGAEMNEIQSAANLRIKGVGDALFKDGAVIKGAGLNVAEGTGVSIGEAGIVYMAGKLYGVPTRTFTIPITGTVIVGIYLISSIVSETQDVGLIDPAIDSGNYGEPGAYRLKVLPQWGFVGDTPPADSDFYPVYTVIDAIVQPHATPPDLSPVALAISRYDVQSTGSNYVSYGLDVIQFTDESSQQVFLVKEGLARINGIEMDSRHAIRTLYPAVADTDDVVAESHAANADPQTVTLNHTPVSAVTLVLITKTITAENVQKGSGGGKDSLAHTSLLAISDVSQLGTTYTDPADYVISGDQIDWSPGGAEPSPASTYQVTYTYTAQYPNETGILGTVTDTTAVINGAKDASTILIGYTYKMPRYDRLCINSAGTVVFVTGVSNPTYPVPPAIPSNLLPLATIYQTWNTATRTCTTDSLHMLPMNELRSISNRVDDLYSLVGDYKLAINTSARDPATKRGLFVDAFYDDDLRDAGLAQTAITLDEVLTLGIDWTVNEKDLTDTQTLTETTASIALQQPLRTKTTAINPYMAFAPMPARVTLTPAMDLWTLTTDTWLNPITRRIQTINKTLWEPGLAYWGPRKPSGYTAAQWATMHTQIVTNNTTTTNTEITIKQVAQPYLRPITIKFVIAGFGSGELLNTVKFDGITVTARATP